jgi:hypothetical protein
MASESAVVRAANEGQRPLCGSGSARYGTTPSPRIKRLPASGAQKNVRRYAACQRQARPNPALAAPGLEVTATPEERRVAIEESRQG